MFFLSTALALAAIPAAVLGAVQTVTVGEGGLLAYNPTNITAAAGDQINFEFHAKNHSVTQSTFTSPCTKAMFNGALGVNSGFLAIPPNSTFANGTFPTWSITINDTTPLWFYCAQKVPAPHCQMGMVFSINATPQKSFDMFLAAAKASSSNTTVPGATGPGALGGSNATSVSGTAAAAGAGATSVSGTAAAAAAAATSASSGSATASQAASNESPTAAPNHGNGATKAVSTRGAAGLLTIVTIGAVLL